MLSLRDLWQSWPDCIEEEMPSGLLQSLRSRCWLQTIRFILFSGARAIIVFCLPTSHIQGSRTVRFAAKVRKPRFQHAERSCIISPWTLHNIESKGVSFALGLDYKQWHLFGPIGIAECKGSSSPMRLKIQRV